MKTCYVYILGASSNPDQIQNAVVPYCIDDSEIFFGPCKKRLRQKLRKELKLNSMNPRIDFTNKEDEIYFVGLNASNQVSRKIVWAGKLKVAMTFKQAYEELVDEKYMKIREGKCFPLNVKPVYADNNFIKYVSNGNLHPNREWISDLTHISKNSKDLDLGNDSHLTRDICFLFSNIFFANRYKQGIDLRDNNSIIEIFRRQFPNNNVDHYNIFGRTAKGYANGLRGGWCELKDSDVEILIKEIKKAKSGMSPIKKQDDNFNPSKKPEKTMKLYIVNVGVNLSDAQKRNVKSPIFNNGTFEFIPIKESKNDSSFCVKRYKDLMCFNDSSKPITSFFDRPELGDYFVHNDPDFTCLTYGDIDTPRSSNLKHAKAGDTILFLARLYDYDGKSFLKSSNLYFIAVFTVGKNLYFDLKRNILPSFFSLRFAENAHYIKYQNGYKENFRIILADKKSSYRFRKALKITTEISELVFNGRYNPKTDNFTSNNDGNTVLNKNGNPTAFSLFHSNTRSIQYFLDTERHETEEKSFNRLLNIIGGKCM